MIEHLRKYTGLIIVLFVLVIIGFVFLDTSTIRASRGGATIMKIDGRSYTDKDFQNLGSGGFELASGLGGYDSPVPLFLYSMAGQAAMFAQTQDGRNQAVETFFKNRILLRSAKEEFGIYPGDEQIDSFIRKLSTFSDQNGAFSEENYRNFIEKGIGRLGLTEADVRELASDIIAQERISAIVSAGLTGSREIVTKEYQFDNQSIRANVARIDLDPIEEKIKVTAEEVKLYWETIQDAFRTQEKRKFTYIISKPEGAEEPPALAPLPEDATDEAKAEFEEKQAARTAEIAEAQRLAKMAADASVDNFLNQLTDGKGTFEELAEKDGWETKTTELFSFTDAPADLSLPLRSSSTQGNALSILFKMILTEDPLSKISPAIGVGENEWIVARLDEIEASRVQTFEEARDEARARLIAEKAMTELQATASAATATIKAALENEKTFAEAAKEAGITSQPVNLTDVTAAYQPDTTKIPGNIFNATKYTDPGNLTEPVVETDRAFVIQVENREIVVSEDAAPDIETGFERSAAQYKNLAFDSWLAARNEAAKIENLTSQ
ncbi:MAG: hypothetical protein ACSHX7_11005 [Luteolibacter sp.]